MNRKEKIKTNRWLSLSDDLMGRIILSDLKFVKNFIVNVTDYTYKDLKNATVTSGEELLPEQILDSTFRTDIIVTLNNEDKVLIEIQKHNNLNSTIKNELYRDRVSSNQKIEDNNYEGINKLTQVVVIYDNQLIPKEKRVLLENYDKIGEISKHKIMDEYRVTKWLDIKGEKDYSLISEELKGWIILFKEDYKDKAIESKKYGKIFSKIIERMESTMNLDEGIRYCDKRKDYDDCLMNLGREEGEKIGYTNGEKIGYSNGEKDGLYKGIELGRDKTLLETAYKMHEKGIPFEDIKDITGIDFGTSKGVRYSLKNNVNKSMVKEKKKIYDKDFLVNQSYRKN